VPGENAPDAHATVSGTVGAVNGTLSASLNAPNAPLNTVNKSDPIEAINRALGPGGDRFESLGSNTLTQWMTDNAVEERDGEYWQRRKLDSGEMALVEVHPQKEVLEADQMADAELSRARLFRNCYRSSTN
jgi:hypothetical protein